MSHKLITGIYFNNKWKVICQDGDWVAFIVDPSFDDTGAPEVKAFSFETVLEKVRIFEEGQNHANRNN